MGWLQNEADVHQHFDQVAAAAQPFVLAQALSTTFRSGSTPMAQQHNA
jgi:hypothetical protein